MKDGVCPKCHADQVYSKRDAFVSKFPVYLESTGTWMTTQHTIQSYLCVICGYMELAVVDAPSIERILASKDWKRVQHATP